MHSTIEEMKYQLARPLFMREIAQYEATRRDVLRDYRIRRILLTKTSNGSYAPTVLRTSNLWGSDWLFSYRPRAGTVVFAGHGGRMTESDPLAFNELRRVSDGFLLKASWLFTRNSGVVGS